jgi:hypothetical protein
VRRRRPDRSGTRRVKGCSSLPNCLRIVSCIFSQPPAAWNWYRCSSGGSGGCFHAKARHPPARLGTSAV